MNPQPDQQLDLLDFIPYTDGGRQGAPPPPPEVTQCRWCHHSEPNGLLLRNNHTPDSYRAIQTTWCIAMDLTLSHLIYWQRRIHDQDATPTSRRRPKHEEDPRQGMARSMERALVVWQHRRDELDAQLDALDTTEPKRHRPSSSTYPPGNRRPHPSPNNEATSPRRHHPDPFPDAIHFKHQWWG